METKLAFITYETPFAPAGGIAAVMGRLPRYVARASGLHTVIITPFHHRQPRMASLPTEDAGRVEVLFNGTPTGVQVRRHSGDGESYFLQPEQPAFFAGRPNPYLSGSTPEEIGRNLLRDALLFGTAAAKTLALIDGKARWVLLMQDWEAATAALALAGDKQGHRLFLTLHNSYDSPATGDDLRRHGIAAELCPGTTVLNRAIPLLEKPVFTVSDQFALDLTEDVFLSRVMADHLKALLEPGLLGVNNGPFVDPALAPDIVSRAASGDFRLLAEWKAGNQKQALTALKGLQQSEERPVWGDPGSFDAGPPACWFVMSGRDDTRQKGYDVAAASIESFLQSGGKARFLLLPVPGDEGLAGLLFLKALAEKYRESVIVLPFRWDDGFSAALQGASFGLMPSLYEPFGMANEFYLRGTPVIGRATGGIVQQVVPLQGAACFSQAARLRSSGWHSSSAGPTGLLFREPDVISAESDWRGINAAAYRIGAGGFPNRVQERRGVEGDAAHMGYRLFRAMAGELRNALADAVRLYENDPGLYYRMLIDGFNFIRHGFAWERAAQEYIRNVIVPR